MAFKTYNSYIDSPVSEKIILAHVHGVKRLFTFEEDGSFYSKTSPYFVVGVKNGTTGLDLVSVSRLEELTDNSKFHYEISTSKLYLFSYDKNVDEVIATFRFFYSNAPINLSWDLGDNSDEVEYEPRIDNSPTFKSQMSQGKKGINLVGSGSLNLINQDKGLNSLYDSIIWDNKDINVYAFNRDLAPSEATLIFRGIISGKSFSSKNVTFNVKDSLYILDSKIPLLKYGSLTREADSLFFKRQIYGRVDNLLIQSIDQVADGYQLTGTLSGKFAETFINGSGTSFLSEVSPDDELIFPNFSVKVEDVLSNTQLRTSALEGSFSNLEALIDPEIHYRNKNRLFQVAGHAIKKWSTTITKIISRNRIVVDSPEGFESGDIISIDGESKAIRRISGSTIVLQTCYNLPHSVGASVTKTEITNVRYGNRQIPIASDNIKIINDSTNGAQIQLSSTAEYDAAPERTINHIFRFVNGRNKVWLGSPTFIDITCVGSIQTGTGPTSYSLMGKWFSVKDESGNSFGFWFKDQVEEGQTTVPKPTAITAIQNTDGGKVKSIPLESRPYTSAEIAVIVGGFISSNISSWQYVLSSNVINLETKDTLDISIGDMGTSGFSQNKTLVGVPSVSQFDLTKFLTTRDFIKSTDQNATSYIEILSVGEKSLVLRTPYSGTSQLESMNYKNVEYIQDDTPVYVNCFGKTKNGENYGEFIETAPEAVADILKQVNLEDRIDTESFEASKERSHYLLSLALPVDYRSTLLPSAKDVINLLNQSTLGSLHITNALTLGYEILDGHIPEAIRQIDDSDIISWSTSDDAFDLSASVVSSYRFIDYDPKLNTKNNKQHTFNSEFANNYTQSSNTSENDLYLYKEADAVETTERDQFINDLSTSVIKIKGSMTLSKFMIGERVILNFAGLYNTYATRDNKLRIGIVSSINNTGEKVDLEILDLGSLFSRAARINDDDSPNYLSSTAAQRARSSYITEDNGTVNEDEETAGTNLIS
jgi:hypothetical protein